ncbi:amidohydrolase [Pedobacter sp. SD-b]|uniref:Amidohydrolase n=1 Tax=Pedobacter segetis TaxID=2793069 RepID=A0ABS1BIU8_9SPHI|nr:amidohydrolase [Pedobacter segetis]MBK0382772.1 amidohydrolase [Pedobacter segetis]
MNLVLDHLVSVRRHLHQNPDISGFEEKTSEFLLTEFIKLNTSEIIEKIAGFGFLVVFDSKIEGDSLLFRAELDGLPIQETSELPYKSTINGKGHQCGHDGHMTILLGLALFLTKHPIQKGKVSLLFQPAEETGEGATAVITDKKFANLKFDEVFALHNLPGYDYGAIVVKENAFTAAVKSMVIKLEGKTAHAAEPENGINPALAVADILQKVEALNFNHPKDDNFKLATLIYVNIGSMAYGVSAADAELHYTTRSWSNENLDDLVSDILDIVASVAANHRLKAKHFFLENFYANINDKNSVGIVRKAADNLGLQLLENDFPFKWGEDFGYFTKKYKGCLFGLGAGKEHPALHHPDYDFPDEIIETGINIFKGIIKERLG